MMNAGSLQEEALLPEMFDDRYSSKPAGSGERNQTEDWKEGITVRWCTVDV